MSSVHYFLHSLQHINHTFAPVSNKFELPSSPSAMYHFSTDNPYEQSIQMFFLLPLEMFVVYTLMYVLMVLIYLCYGKPHCIAFNLETYAPSRRQQQPQSRKGSDHQTIIYKDQKISLTPCAKSTRAILCGAAFLLMVVSIYSGIMLEHTTNVIGTNISATYAPYQTNIDRGQHLEQCMAQMRLQYTQYAVAIDDGLVRGESAMHAYVSDAQSLTLSSTGVSVSSTSILQLSHSFSQFCIYLGMLICVLLAVTFFMSLFSGAMIKFMSCLTFTFVTLLLLLFAAQFAISIFASDACANPNAAILQMHDQQNANLHENNNNNSVMQVGTMRYYLYCDAQHAYNPLYTQFNTSYAYIVAMNETVHSLSNASLSRDYYTLLADLQTLSASLACDTIYSDKEVVVDFVCNEGISEWFRVYILQLSIVVVLIVRNCCLCCGLKYDHNLSQQPHTAAALMTGDKRIMQMYGATAVNHNHHAGAVPLTATTTATASSALPKYAKYSIHSPPVYSMHEHHHHDMKLEPCMRVYVVDENNKTDCIEMSDVITKTIHDLKQEIQIKLGYPVQTQTIVFNDREVGCNHSFKELGIENGSLVQLQLDHDANSFQNFTVEYNGFVELNSYIGVGRLQSTDIDGNDHDGDGFVGNDDDDDDDDHVWSIHLRQWRIHTKLSHKAANHEQQIGVICYQYNGKVEWKTSNGVKCKAGDIILRNFESFQQCQFHVLIEEIFGARLDVRLFVGNAFKVGKFGLIKPLSNQTPSVGKIEQFWLSALLDAWRRNVSFIDIEKHQKQMSRFQYDQDKFQCDLCGVDGYIKRERNSYLLLTAK